jgi:hypothetical protein
MTKINLLDLPRDSIVHLTTPASDGSTWFRFHHVDGMYSLSVTEKGGPLHLSALTEVDVSEEGRYSLS